MSSAQVKPPAHRDAFQTSDLIASFPDDRSSGIPTRLSVAAKIADPGADKLRHLANEGKIYANFQCYPSRE
ncbi:hypothetical protein FRB97_009748 [Tulasnella sp. 331]|nr:hypothetical protein FRB97_009748 [Tulasnella sp. 331]